MSISSLAARRAVLAGIAALACGLACPGQVKAQLDASPPAVKFQVKSTTERLEMNVNTSKVVDFPFDVPKMLVNNPDIVRVIPISPKSIQLSALRAGVTQVNVWDADGNVTTVDVMILGDVGELDGTLKTLFPEASVRLRPLNSSLYISGYVPKAEMVTSISNVARDYFPNIINDLTVGGVQKVLLHVKVMEVSRTKLRTLGFDWAATFNGDFINQTASGVLGFDADGLVDFGRPGIRFGISNDSSTLPGILGSPTSEQPGKADGRTDPDHAVGAACDV